MCFSHRRQKECRPASHIQCSITLDQQNTLSGSPKLIDLVDQSNLFPPSRPRATLGAVRMTRQASALGTGTSSTTVCHGSSDEITPFPCFVGLLYPLPMPDSIADRDRDGSPLPASASPWQRQAQRHLSHALRPSRHGGRASHTTAGRRLPALHLGRRRGAGSESTRRGAYINSAGLD